MRSSEKAQSVETMRAPVITMPASVSFTILAARSLSCRSTGLERSTCGLINVWVIATSLSRQCR
jgi:hypothetical protein